MNKQRLAVFLILLPPEGYARSQEELEEREGVELLFGNGWQRFTEKQNKQR